MPQGNMRTTGIAVVHDDILLHLKEIQAKESEDLLQYWNQIQSELVYIVDKWTKRSFFREEDRLVALREIRIVCGSPNDLSYQKAENLDLMSTLKWHCAEQELDLHMQNAVIKPRWTGEPLPCAGLQGAEGANGKFAATSGKTGKSD
ncbi:hypothetical protein SAMN04487866_1261 [Thermoactinomyces sp. DSM 45891]|uniref:hypothetical protein n=1 Tax=Thermoactinomyces sp. DSM 45891 TaxID=1761907 RepID=UPI0009104CF3|nr:hypothetical protein [Thermoactinomyces sp. DSM 45891]SFX79040.1 hypothetical protein SAMN04487866_1261 [Thermoactinomyces sp. DSM 45891]